MFQFAASGSGLVLNIVIERGFQGPRMRSGLSTACTEVRPPDPGHTLNELDI